MLKAVKTTVKNNGIYVFPNKAKRRKTCFAIAIRDAIVVNGIKIDNKINDFIRELVEMITEIFGWNNFINTYTLETDDEIIRYSTYLTDYFQETTNCVLGVIKENKDPIIFGNPNKKIIWIEEKLSHYEAVKEFEP